MVDRKLMKLIKDMCKALSLGKNFPGTDTAWGQLPEQQFCGKDPEGFGGQQVAHRPAVSPGSKDGQ